MPCEHNYHQDSQALRDCAIQRIADALEAIYEKLPDVRTPADLADFIQKTNAILDDSARLKP